MKDVATCDKPRDAGSKLIRGFPNGETPLDKLQRLLNEYIVQAEPTEGTETS